MLSHVTAPIFREVAQSGARMSDTRKYWPMVHGDHAASVVTLVAKSLTWWLGSFSHLK